MPIAKRVPMSLRVVGTVEDARSDGFLCVISSFLTFRKPEVTASPLLRSANTAAAPPTGAEEGGGGDANSAGGGGGGGGGAGGAADDPAVLPGGT